MQVVTVMYVSVGIEMKNQWKNMFSVLQFLWIFIQAGMFVVLRKI